MLQPWIIILISLIYTGILFAIAYYGDNQNNQQKLKPYKPLIYSLSLAVYCTSWTYYGAVGNASTSGWIFFAIYIGPILMFIFGHHYLKRIANICIENNITTIADFIASRYGKAQSLAVLVTIIALMGTLPYIALQLKAVTTSYDVIATYSTLSLPYQFTAPFLNDTGLVLAIIMAVFSIIFGTRFVNASEHHQGIILAIAFESVVKLFSLIAVCLFAIYVVFDGTGDILNRASQDQSVSNLLLSPGLQKDFLQATFISYTLLSMAAIFCLPRQFHVAFVEAEDTRNMSMSRWLFPVYLALTSVVVVPIALTGLLQFGSDQVDTDMFVLNIPLHAQSELMTLMVFIGGFSAATSMVIIAVITLSTMICNDIVMPLLFKFSKLKLKQRTDITSTLLLIRRLAIIAILLLSYAYYRYINAYTALASIGLIAFVAAIQFAPAIVGGVYWKKGTRQGATFGLLAGFSIWLYTLFIPTLADTGWLTEEFVENGPWGIAYLKPYALFGLDNWNPITHSLILSLTANIGFYIYFSLTRKSNLLERIQAAKFTQTESQHSSTDGLPWWSTVAIGELRNLAVMFIGEKATQKAFTEYATKRSKPLLASEKADAELIGFTEKLLAGAIGAASARLIISSVLRNKDLPLEDVFSIVDEASQAISFNQELLNNTIEHIDQGISVVDENLELVAWNSRYLELYQYPKNLIYVGRPIADVIRYNAKAGEFASGDIESQIEGHLEHMRRGKPHSYIRYRKNGTVIQVQGQPMPGVGYVTSFTDVTELKNTERELRKINENLEKIVEGRTNELSVVNKELKQAIESKNQFLTAVNHDLMQPLNAARLFTSALAQKVPGQHDLTDKISNSIHSAEEIIHTLLDIAKLNSGSIKPKIVTLNINDVLSKLSEEFSLSAQRKNIKLKIIACNVFISSDTHLLRRILQNLISNALRYTQPGGRVTIGCRRTKLDSEQPELRLQVHDTGIGIPHNELRLIFDEFKRLDNQLDGQNTGIGLGLAIVKRMSVLIDSRIEVRSTPGKGSVFSLIAPVVRAKKDAGVEPFRVKSNVHYLNPATQINARLVCIDNDSNVLEAMQAQLMAWSCDAVFAKSCDDAIQEISNINYKPDLLLIDYHLNEENGIDAIKRIRTHLGSDIPAIIISADIGETLQQQVSEHGHNYLSKPVNPAALRNLIMRHQRLRSRSLGV